MVLFVVIVFIDNLYIVIVFIFIGGFGYQIIFCMLSVLVVEFFDKGQMVIVNGMCGLVVWIVSFLFLLIIGVIVDKIGFNLLFIVMGFFDFIGVFFLVIFIVECCKKCI